MKMTNMIFQTAGALFLALSVGAAQAVQVQVNGGFENGDFTGWDQFPTGTGQQTVISTNCSAGTYCGSITNDTISSNSLFKNANVGIGVVAPNSAYTVSFDARGSFATPGGVAFAEFFSEVSGGGVSKAEILGGAPLAINPDPNVWTSFTFTGTTGPDVGGGVTLQLGATNGPAAGTFMVYDNIIIDVTAVPVPAAVWLFGSGLLGLVGVARRRKG